MTFPWNIPEISHTTNRWIGCDSSTFRYSREGSNENLWRPSWSPWGQFVIKQQFSSHFMTNDPMLFHQPQLNFRISAKLILFAYEHARWTWLTTYLVNTILLMLQFVSVLVISLLKSYWWDAEDPWALVEHRRFICPQ